MSAGPPVIQLRGATRSFGDLVAVDDVTFDVAPGEVLGLLGHNGAGKTTLIRVINGLLRRDRGEVAVFGMDPVEDGASVRKRSGVLTTYPALEDWLTPRENLAIHAAVHGLDTTTANGRMDGLLEQFGIDPADRRPSRDLSAGQKQRVALARALVHDPDLLLLDEPTANLDPIAAREVREVIRDLARERGRTVVMSTHNLSEATQICDRVAILRDGRLLGVGAIDELARTLDHRRTSSIEVDADDRDRAVAALAASGIEVRDVTDHRARLEDVYVSLHGDAAAGLEVDR